MGISVKDIRRFRNCSKALVFPLFLDYGRNIREKILVVQKKIHYANVSNTLKCIKISHIKRSDAYRN